VHTAVVCVPNCSRHWCSALYMAPGGRSG